MPAAKTLADLNDGRFNEEPKWKKGEPSIGPGSRLLMGHILWNVLQCPIPRIAMKGKKQGAIPSSDADSLQRVDHPFAARLSNLRSMQRTLSSLEGAKKHIRPESDFGGTGDRQRGIVRMDTLGFGLIERIFSIAKKSLALNLDKRGRFAFTLPDPAPLSEEASQETREILAKLPSQSGR